MATIVETRGDDWHISRDFYWIELAQRRGMKLVYETAVDDLIMRLERTRAARIEKGESA